MKRQSGFLILGLFFGAFNLFGQCGNLYIGGVIDAGLPGGVPKGVQLCASGDIADLSLYGIGSANNGGGTDGQEFTFPAEAISSGDCFWIASEATSFNAFFGFDPCYTSGSMGINGDDAIELFCSGAVTDLFGDPSTDGNGECWEYLDGWATNNLTAPNSGTFSCDDWTFSGINVLDGETTNATATTPYPSPEQVCPMVLPVTLKSFSANMRNESVELTWVTALEVNNDYFEIHRSTNGRDFEPVGKVAGKGITYEEQSYSFMDLDPVSGTNYYTLVQVDLDGGSERFDVIKVENNSKGTKIYPTSIVDYVAVELEQPMISAKFTIMNVAGQVIRKQTLESSSNSIDLSDLRAGIYFLKVENGGRSHVGRIVKH